jgi:hypothetical protein
MAGEKRLQQAIVKELEKLGVLVYKFESPGRSGVPDLLCLPAGTPAFMIEVKNPNGKGRLSKLQDYQIGKIRAQGVNVYVVESYERLDQVLFAEELV